jgi:hypothetical protein
MFRFQFFLSDRRPPRVPSKAKQVTQDSCTSNLKIFLRGTPHRFPGISVKKARHSTYSAKFHIELCTLRAFHKRQAHLSELS